MFCASLRRRPSYASSLPTLTRQSSLGLRENQLTTHDIALPLTSKVDPKTGHTLSARHLLVLLLSPSTVSDAKLHATMERIRHFASLTGGQGLAIVFLLSPPRDTTFTSAKQVAQEGTTEDEHDSTAGTLAYAKLQAEMLNADIPNISILPLCKLDGLADLLKKHVGNLTGRQQPKHTAQPAPAFDLLAQCTATPPMAQQTAYVLSDVFPSLRELATACTSVTSAPSSSSPTARGTQMEDDGGSECGRLKQLRYLVGDQECRDVVEFWREEWTVE